MGTFIRSLTTASFAVLCLLACGDGGTPANDAATPRDTGTADTGEGDTGTGGDSGSSDSGGGSDTGAADSGADSGPAPEGCALTYSGCSTLEDHTGEATVDVAVVMSGVTFAYDPHCIRVSTGTMVNIPGSALHPLNNASCSPAETPLPTVPATTDDTYTFTTPGAYGFFCSVHGANSGAGMAGLIVVE